MTFSSILGFALTLTFLGLIVLFIVVGRAGAKAQLRSISAFNHLRRAIGRAVESGSQLHLSLGRGSITGTESAAGFVGLSTLEGVIRSASTGDNPPVATTGDATLAILARDTLAAAYSSIGIGEQYDPHSGQLTGMTPFSFAAGTLSTIADPKTSTHLFLGHFGSEVALLGDRVERSQDLSLAGSDNLAGQAVLYASVEEPLIGEELFASGAYLHAGPAHIASLQAQDVVRWLLIAFILAGVALKFLGVDTQIGNWLGGLP